MIFVFGSARSGSTWLAKLFDSHPDLLYLHEPDIPDRGSDLLPHWFEREPTARQIASAKIYLQRLTQARHARTIGIRPFFHKHYRGPAAEAARLSLIYGTKLLERAGLGRISDSLSIPDLASGAPRLVLKSVSALGRAEVFLAAEPALDPVLLIRHPCGYVGSMLRGKKVGGMTSITGLGRLATTRAAARLGLNSAALAKADEITFLAWTWLLSNAEAHGAIKRANGTILVYEELTADPAGQLKTLFANLALGWPQQTETFLKRSQDSDGDYYSVFRDPGKAAQRWRDELDAPTVNKIRAVVERDPIGAQFFQT